MDSAVTGLIGAGIGALAGMTGTILAQIIQSRREHKRWQLARKEEAYSKSLRYLLKVLSRRSVFTSQGIAYLSKDDTPEWFSDLGEAQAWISTLRIYCSTDMRVRVKLVALKINAAISSLMGYSLSIGSVEEAETIQAVDPAGLDSLAEVISFAYLQILECAEKELGEHIL